MSKNGLIPAFDMDIEMCKSCMLMKITKKPFQNVKRKTKALELIHSNLCNLHATPSLGNKKYFVTFIDDASRAVLRPPDPKLKALGERGIECIFVGYAKHSKAFRMLLSGKKQLMMRWIPGCKTLGCKPPGCKPLGCKLIFKRKLKVDRTVEKFKARSRLVIQGFRQKSGIDYFNTYATVARISTIRLLIDIASIHNLIIHQMDVDLTKKFLSSKFSMKDIGEADVILGIRIKHESNGIAISQSHYIEKVLKKFNYFDCTPVSTLIDTSEKLMPNNGQDVSQLEYSRVIGCLMYAMTCTRPDIAFAAGKQSRYTILLVLEGYTDASWINNTEDDSSTSGWVFLLGGAAGKEAKWLGNLIFEILLWSKPIAPISIRCDSAATLAKAYSQMYNGKSRHLGVRHSMIRKLITNGVISIEFVRSQQNLADHLTKGLVRYLVIKSTEGMGLKSN
ncbi:zinc finger, CCHC-type containing protein [Tanacetum coccineum]